MIDLRQKYARLPLWAWGLIGFAALAGLITFAVTRPAHGTWRYGACRVMLETMVRFPITIDVMQVAEAAQSATIVYSDINAYGTQQVKIFECHYTTDAGGNIRLSRIVQNRRAYGDDIVADLNKKLPVILTQELDTRLPPPLASRLENIRR